MRRYLFLLITLFSIHSKSFSYASQFKVAEVKLNGFTYTIDPRIELWNIMGATMGNPDIKPDRLLYKEEAIAQFIQYKDHKAMQHLLQVVRGGWNLSSSSHFFLHLDLNLNYIGGLDSAIIKQSGGIENVKSLAKDLQAFARESNFFEFYNNHSEFYKLILSNVKYNFREVDEKERIENFYGMKNNKYIVILNILEGSGNFAVSVKTKSGNDLYAAISCQSVLGQIPSFAPDYQFYELLYHEFSHSFCNPLVYANEKELSKYVQLFAPISESLQQQGYEDWITAIHEHLVRVSSILLAEDKFGKEVADLKFYKNQIGKRFIYIEPLREKMQVYLNSRDTYKDYASFFPEIIRTFSEITESDVVELQQRTFERGKSDVDFIPSPENTIADSTMIFIVSSHEKDDGNDLVKNYAEHSRNITNPKIRIISDEEALKTNLAGSDIRVFGTLNGNSFLKKYIAEIPVIIKDDYVIFKEKLFGTDFQMTLCWLNPFSPQHSMEIYTAQQAKDIKEYEFSTYKSSFQYWVAKNHVTLSAGNFSRYWDTWIAN